MNRRFGIKSFSGGMIESCRPALLGSNLSVAGSLTAGLSDCDARVAEGACKLSCARADADVAAIAIMVERNSELGLTLPVVLFDFFDMDSFRVVGSRRGVGSGRAVGSGVDGAFESEYVPLSS